MCTVTYLPLHQREFILTSNRDEETTRPSALPVQEYTVYGRSIYFPKDQKANGTWIAYDVKGYTLCLLNGANRPHVRKDVYRKSRGLVLLDFYQYNNPETYFKDYDFTGIEPFTLIMAYSCSDTEKVLLYELKWDELRAELITHDPSMPRIWSSVTLYSPEVIDAREKWFDSWLEKHDTYTSDAILFFHHFGGTGKAENDLVMNRTGKKTVSITCINKNLTLTEIVYEDILNKKLYNNKIIGC